VSKFNDWYESLDTHTKIYLDKQPLWHDQDLLKAALIGFILGIVLGLTI
jgi:hypothetical protein